MAEVYRPIVTPAQIEQRMLDCMAANANAHETLRQAETAYAQAKTPLALARAKARFKATEKARELDAKWNEGDREAYVLLETEELQSQWEMAELHVKLAKSLVAQVANEIELLRSISASVRNSLAGA